MNISVKLIFSLFIKVVLYDFTVKKWTISV